jgi:hypothetical protein
MAGKADNRNGLKPGFHGLFLLSLLCVSPRSLRLNILPEIQKK